MGGAAVAGSGETGPISGVSLAVNMTISGLFAIALYNCLEILISLITRFKRHDGLYFWSMMVATFGIVLHSIVVLLRYYSLGPNFLLCVLTCVGWYGMVTGQSVVLYSRLHLIVEDKSKTRWVLYMIIINFLILHVPTTILFLGSNTVHSSRFIGPFNVYERIQLAGFCIQETIISGLYIWETARGLKPIFAVRKAMERKIIRYLVIVNVLVILLDLSLIVTQYMSHFNIQTTYKPVVYSIKLKMEFVVLNKLLLLVQHSDCNCMHMMGEPESTAPDPSQLECQSVERNPSTRTGSDVPMQLSSVHKFDPPGRLDHNTRTRSLQFLTPYCERFPSSKETKFALTTPRPPKPNSHFEHDPSPLRRRSLIPGPSTSPISCKVPVAAKTPKLGEWRYEAVSSLRPRHRRLSCGYRDFIDPGQPRPDFNTHQS